ncbi:hypothetical protein AYI69_g2225 [Smittium culicis]|uniref:Uncharacterized protein n=2 Tax=Smittium culicis TaxID=133412 RepID=A0A1R1YN80_9FUNG|nr:hypothetical protein AYI69_g2225 [Smittium culicis]
MDERQYYNRNFNLDPPSSRKKSSFIPPSQEAPNDLGDGLSTALARQYIYDSINSPVHSNAQTANNNNQLKAPIQKNTNNANVSSENAQTFRDRFISNEEHAINVAKMQRISFGSSEEIEQRPASKWYKDNVLFIPKNKAVAYSDVEDDDSVLASIDGSKSSIVLVDIKNRSQIYSSSKPVRVSMNDTSGFPQNPVPPQAPNQSHSKIEPNPINENANQLLRQTSDRWNRFEYSQYKSSSRNMINENTPIYSLKHKIRFGTFCFLFGFLLFPLWWIGSFYPPHDPKDHLKKIPFWRKANANMSIYSFFFLALIITLIILNGFGIPF